MTLGCSPSFSRMANGRLHPGAGNLGRLQAPGSRMAPAETENGSRQRKGTNKFVMPQES